jgi:hypothetical protein
MSERTYPCPSCRGVVAIPSRRRTLTIEQVRTIHETSCPGRGRTIKDTK